jgi:ParB family chromosome partitioning protein
LPKGEEIAILNVDKLDPNPFQARTEYLESDLRDLGKSIADDGLIHPIVVRSKGDRYQVCTGWRRVLAARLVGIVDVPAIVRSLSDKQMTKYNLVENLRRKDLNVVEKARGYRTMQKTWSLTQEQVADVLGLSRDQVAEALRVLTFPPDLQKLLSHDTITQTHAEALARLSDSPNLLQEATTKVLDAHLTTSQTEQLVQDMLEGRQLQKDLQEYVTSEDFVWTLTYLLPDPPELKTCPLCFAPELRYDDEKDLLCCKRCGWNDAAMDKLHELKRRIRAYRLKRLGIRYWFEIHSQACPASCTLETPHTGREKT